MILVVGATGQLGGAIARALLARGDPVRILVRPGSAYQNLAALGADVVPADLRVPESLAPACDRVDVVVTTANSARRGGGDTVEAVDLGGTRALVDAAHTAGVRHFIYTSVLGVTPDSPMPFLAAKAKSEQHLRASGMTWTILAPNAFMESWPLVVVGGPAAAHRPVVLVGEGRRRHTFVAVADVAAFAVTATTHPAARDRHIPIGGPEALSWLDVVSIYERILGRRLEVRFVKPGEPVPGVPEAVLPLLAGFEMYESVFDAGGVAAEFGVRPTPLEEVARRALARSGG